MKSSKHTISIIDQSSGDHVDVRCESGANLRQVLLRHDLSPYVDLTERLNCGGLGICATCGVHVTETSTPRHWHDWLAEKFRYPD